MTPPPLSGGSPGPLSRPASRRSPPTGRKFPCRQVRGQARLRPGRPRPEVPVLWVHRATSPKPTTTRRPIREHDFDEFLATRSTGRARPRRQPCQVPCTGCGAVVVLEDRVATDKCPYCSTHLENKPEAVKDLILPESLLPFSVDRDARDRFNKWIDGLWFAPTELKQLANLGQFGSVYAPFWTYDAMTYTRYTGRARRRLLGHRVVHGCGRQTADPAGPPDPVVSGLGRGPALLRRRARPGLEDAPPATWPTGRPVGTGGPGAVPGRVPQRARDRALPGRPEGGIRRCQADHGATTITGPIHRDIGGDHQRIDSRRTSYVGVTFKHTLLPIWVANYRYREKLSSSWSTGARAGSPGSGRGAGGRSPGWLC